jgi:hypothetical protein
MSGWNGAGYSGQVYGGMQGQQDYNAPVEQQPLQTVLF